MELGKQVRRYYIENTEEVIEDEPVYIYESPDGKKVYRRRFGDYDNKELIKD